MANYPGSVSTNANLYIAVNGLQTTLAANINNSVTTIQLTSTTGFPTTGLVTIDNNEVVSYTGISGPNLTGCTRGADGTTALSHNTGVTVGATIVAAHHNLLKDEVIAIETALGANLSNVFPATPTTGTGNVVLQTSPTITTPTINSPTLTSPALGTPASGVMTNVTGLPLTTGVTGVLPNGNTTATPNATANTIVSRDANSNTKVNTLIENFATIATAAGTTTLTAASAPIQQFTGTTTQNVVLPDATTLATGYQISILNRSTGIVSVKNNGGTVIQTINGGSQTTFTATDISTANGVWDASTSSGSSTAVSQYVRYIVGTASGAYTGSTTVFDLPFAYTQDGKTLQVFYNGQMLSPSNYTETTTTEVTMSTALVTGAEIVFRSLSGGSTATAVTYIREDYVVGTALNNYTGSTTVFNLVNTYVPGGKTLTVYVDGDLQTLGATIDYQETNGTTVTFVNALVSGQKVAILFNQAAAAAGTVGSGTSGQVPYYSATGTTVVGTDAVNVDPTNGNGIIKGTTTNDNAATGKVGEYVESVITSGQNAAASGNYSDLTSISLTAGDWDVTFNAEFQFVANTINFWSIGISTTSGNSTTGLVEGSNQHFFTYLPTAAVDTGGSLPAYRLKLSTTTTVYAKIRANYTSTAPQFIGRLSARRMR